MTIFEWVLTVINATSLIFMVGVLIASRRRHKRHLINLIFIRMKRMDPVVFIKRRRRKKWRAVGTHELGWEVGTEMGWKEEMDLLDEYYNKKMAEMQRGSGSTAGTHPPGP